MNGMLYVHHTELYGGRLLVLLSSKHTPVTTVIGHNMVIPGGLTVIDAGMTMTVMTPRVFYVR